MEKEEIKKSISQNVDRISRKKDRIKKLQTEVKQLEEKNEALKNELILMDVRNAAISTDDISDLLALGKLVKASGLNADDIKEMFSPQEKTKEVNY